MGVRPDAGGGSGGGFEVWTGSVSDAAATLTRIGQELDGDIGRARDQALAAHGAIPPSDLQDAYGYCWGRWSQALQDAATGVDTARLLTERAAHGYTTAEQGNAGMLAPN